MDAGERVLESAVQQVRELEYAGIITSRESKQILLQRSKYERLLGRRRSSNERAFFAYTSYELVLGKVLKFRAKVCRRFLLFYRAECNDLS